jgi:hypothetical protein
MITMEYDSTAQILVELQIAVDNGVDLSKPDLLGDAIITRALDRDLHKVAVFLIKNGASLAELDSEGFPALATVFRTLDKGIISTALSSESFQCVNKELINRSFDALCLAFTESRKFDDITLISYVLNTANIDINKCVVDGESIIFRAIHEFSADLVNLFISYGIDLNVKSADEDGFSPLDYAKDLLNTTYSRDTTRHDKQRVALNRIIATLEALESGRELSITQNLDLVTVVEYTDGLEDGYIFHELSGAFHCFLTHAEIEKGYPKLGRTPAIRTTSGYNPLKLGDFIVTTVTGERSVIKADELAALKKLK